MHHCCENYVEEDCEGRRVCKIKLTKCPYGGGKVLFTPAVIIDKEGLKVGQ